MIQMTIQGGVTPYIVQWCEKPTVYLDHWAWRKISETEHLATRFAYALKALQGTLAFSWLNVIEFGRLSDEQQTTRADALLDDVLPRIFMLTPAFHKVIGTEDRLMTAGEKVIAPHADLLSLKAFFQINLSNPDSLKIFRKQALFQLAQKSELATAYERLTNNIISYLTSLRSSYKNNLGFSKIVKRKPRGNEIQCGTRFIARELVGSILKDAQLRIDGNQVIDLCHAVVPVAYCDYVLLDKHWETQVEKARKRIRDAGMLFPMARIFSEKNDGIERFLCRLESDSGVSSTT